MWSYKFNNSVIYKTKAKKRKTYSLNSNLFYRILKDKNILSFNSVLNPTGKNMARKIAHGIVFASFHFQNGQEFKR